MQPMIRLANGTRVDHFAVRMIEARELYRQHTDRDGRVWEAAVHVETKSQLIRVLCATYEEALAMRDALGDEVDRRRMVEGKSRLFAGSHVAAGDCPAGSRPPAAGDEGQTDDLPPTWRDHVPGGRLAEGVSPGTTKNESTEARV